MAQWQSDQTVAGVRTSSPPAHDSFEVGPTGNVTFDGETYEWDPTLDHPDYSGPPKGGYVRQDGETYHYIFLTPPDDYQLGEAQIGIMQYIPTAYGKHDGQT